MIGIYLHEFTNNEREISIPHEALPSAVLKTNKRKKYNDDFTDCPKLAKLLTRKHLN